jgi:deazaflavin-dependent oxidoreductase (nitroreductase family)
MSERSTYNERIIAQFRAQAGHTDFDGPVLLLTTIGAKSGQPRTTPLGYSRDGDQLVVIASAGGSPTHPAWYFNLVAHPVVTVEVGADTFAACATVAEGAERERLYALVALVPGFSNPQEKTTRQIPVIILTRLDEG